TQSTIKYIRIRHSLNDLQAKIHIEQPYAIKSDYFALYLGNCSYFACNTHSEDFILPSIQLLAW
ncbi:MAG TPA: hypothetical protein PLQ21_01795, partial [Candidatus Kapabacteria bacterium]|nr:hypothetical protein [Candidatus Kapabacteria bacterium]